MELERQIFKAVIEYYADEVQILGTWAAGPNAIWLVYRRTIDESVKPWLTVGRRFEFTERMADGTIEGYARDIALDLVEPVGSPIWQSRKDKYGIVWVALPHDLPTPTPPEAVSLKATSGS